MRVEPVYLKDIDARARARTDETTLRAARPCLSDDEL